MPQTPFPLRPLRSAALTNFVPIATAGPGLALYFTENGLVRLG